MPKIDHSKKLTASITIKLTQADYNLARALADRQQLPLAEWARDRFLQMLGCWGASPAAYAILAEILACEDTVAGLLCALGRDGRLTAERAKQIVDAAHAHKYRDVPALFKDARSEIEARSQRPTTNELATETALSSR